MSYILDLILVFIIIFFVVSSARRGFIRVLIEVLGFVAAVVLSFTISTPLSSMTYDKIIEPSVLKSVNESSSQSTNTVVDNTWNSMPKFVTANAERLGVSKEKLSESVSRNISNGAGAAVKSASQDIIKPVAVKVLGLCYSTIIFAALLFVVKILAKAVNKLFSISVVGTVNRALGGAVGLLKGAIFAAFFVAVISIIISFTGNGFWIFTYENIENSHIFKSLVQILPFKIF